MFTGLIEAKEQILKIDTSNISVVKPKDWDDLKLGDSVAINGVCLSITKLNKDSLDFDYSAETKKITTISKLKTNSTVNLERAMKLGDRLGGHIVQGHIDSIAKVKYLRKKSNFYELCLELKETKLVVKKGSIAIDGVSLTINEIAGNLIKLMIIPETINRTIIKDYKIGQAVNIEFDILGKYIRKI